MSSILLCGALPHKPGTPAETEQWLNKKYWDEMASSSGELKRAQGGLATQRCDSHEDMRTRCPVGRYVWMEGWDHHNAVNVDGRLCWVESHAEFPRDGETKWQHIYTSTWNTMAIYSEFRLSSGCLCPQRRRAQPTAMQVIVLKNAAGVCKHT